MDGRRLIYVGLVLILALSLGSALPVGVQGPPQIGSILVSNGDEQLAEGGDVPIGRQASTGSIFDRLLQSSRSFLRLSASENPLKMRQAGLKGGTFRTVFGSSSGPNSDISLHNILDNTESPICTNPRRQMAPAIYGDRIVWTDYRNGNADIYMYDFELGIEMQVTTDENDQVFPAIYDDRIVYIDNRRGNGDIYMYDLSTGTETAICTDPAKQLSPAIYEDKIAWMDYRNSPTDGFYYPDIYMYDLSTGSEIPICIHEPHYSPSFTGGGYVSIYEDKLVWHDWRNGNADIYMFDLSIDEEMRITTDPSSQVFPDIYEDKVVWMDNRNMPPGYLDTEYWDIYMYDLTRGEVLPVSQDPETSEKLPAIHGDRIVWSKGWDIYSYDLARGIETSICSRPGLHRYPDIHGSRIVYQGPGAIEPNIKLLFVPLNWTDTQEEFNRQVHNQTDFFINAIPLSVCPNKISVTALNVETQNFSHFECETLPIRHFVNSLGINMSDYDKIVGMVDISPCGDTLGKSNRTDTAWVTTTFNTVTAHELGHTYGLSDEYCSNPAGSSDCRCNDGDYGDMSWTERGCYDIGDDGAESGDLNWLDSALGCDPSGTTCCEDCSAINYGICCDGNQNDLSGRCVMSYADAPGPRDFCNHCRDWLSDIAELNCHSPEEPLVDQVIDLTVLIYPDNIVKEEKIILKRGRATRYYQRERGYNLVVTDIQGNILWSQGFNIYFDYMGPVVSGVDYSGIKYEYFPFSYKIPYEPQMYELKLYHGQRVIFSKILNFCNNNNICESTETYKTCPQDCSLDQSDGICIPNSDNECDPDCAEGVDPDCVIPPLPDLVITEIKYDSTNNKAGYVVKNIGDATAPEYHYTTLWVEGEEVCHDQVDVDLIPNQSYTGWFDCYTWPECQRMRVTACADNYNEMEESNEQNNCLERECTGVAGPLGIEISASASATQVCGAEYSHKLKVSWEVSGGKPPMDVTMEITKPDGSVELVGVSKLEGERTFRLNYPGGGTVSVKVNAQDAAGSSSSASATASLAPCSGG